MSFGQPIKVLYHANYSITTGGGGIVMEWAGQHYIKESVVRLV